MNFDLDITLGNNVHSFEVELQQTIQTTGGDCPIITSIDGGDSGPDTQFEPINGLLDGGGI